MNNDAIATALTAIRNGIIRRKAIIKIPSTKVAERIVQILVQEGFVKNVVKHKDNGKEFPDVSLKYLGKRKDPYVAIVKRISKPGLRVYSDRRQIPKILGGMGIAISSTSHGLMTDREARQKRIGGEILRHVW
uniref:ribosomal protein S8 n=1 Tax=Elaphoglossum yoshinagae TaxID=32140 RepID=UPI0022FD8E8A|nr:ribosomal protein S8 [Elaphoglossum yoshinagae]WAU47638.1 ribosomal protein S8 [Elaphoglossum yoshinagae]